MPIDPEELLLRNLDAINRIVAFICKRHRLEGADADDFAATVRLRIIEDDYKVLRSFLGRSKFTTYISVVIQRMLIDYRTHDWGKWHASAAAERLGKDAVRLECLIHRDGRTFDEAVQLLCADRPDLTSESLWEIAQRLPPREPRRRSVDIDEAKNVASTYAAPIDREDAASQVTAVVRRFIDQLPDEDRLLIRLRFDCSMTVAQIARSMNLDQKRLYRRLEAHFRSLRTQLETAGFARADIDDLIGDRGVLLDFQLGNRSGRPSMQDGGTAAAVQKEIPR
jgi:RNA polymerase sigma factor (sigma-70 family)